MTRAAWIVVAWIVVASIVSGCGLLPLSAGNPDAGGAPDASVEPDPSASWPDGHCSAPDPSGETWVRCFPTGKDAVVRAVTVGRAGEVAFAGHFRNAAFSFLGTTLEPGEPEAVFVAKLDARGELQWARRIAVMPRFTDIGPHEGWAVTPKAVAVGDDGSVAVAGTYAKRLQFTDDVLLAMPEPRPGDPLTDDVFVARYGPDGTFQWARRIGRERRDDDVSGVWIDSAGDVIVAGAWEGFGALGGALAGAYHRTGYEQWALPLPEGLRQVYAADRLDDGTLVIVTDVQEQQQIGSYVAPSSGTVIAFARPDGTWIGATPPPPAGDMRQVIANGDRASVIHLAGAGTWTVGSHSLTLTEPRLVATGLDKDGAVVSFVPLAVSDLWWHELRPVRGGGLVFRYPIAFEPHVIGPELVFEPTEFDDGLGYRGVLGSDEVLVVHAPDGTLVGTPRTRGMRNEGWEHAHLGDDGLFVGGGYIQDGPADFDGLEIRARDGDPRAYEYLLIRQRLSH